MSRLSLRARAMRACLRVAVKSSIRASGSVDRVRKNLALVTPLVPRPPRSTETAAILVGGVAADCITTPASRPDRHVLYLHGGSYVAGQPKLYRDITWRIATLCRTRVVCIDYRLAPEHPFPAALDDCVAAYRGLLAAGADPRRIAVMGDSAGGGLTLAAMLRLRDEGVALPVAAAVVSPWTDLALTGESLRLNAKRDPLLPVELAPRVVELVLAGADPRHPYASPLYGDPSGLPPTLIQVGGDDALRDDAVRMAEKMRAAGCTVELEVWPGLWHVWHALVRVVPEARAAIVRIASFMEGKL
ncbi:MAG TPA: alpha/beta hydrolase [Xanthobacteraceae bacterium]|nr:alpha/beta hydrolase [Xanthobacteraceae bacterium]